LPPASASFPVLAMGLPANSNAADIDPFALTEC
jgi:hypothetical protein